MTSFRMMYIDDSPEDLRIVSSVVQRVDGSVEVLPFLSGELALAKLEDDQNNHLPDVILLDLNMPGMSGHDVLKRLKSSDRLRPIPVVVFTSSNQSSDVRTSYEEHANSVIIKPGEFMEYMELFEEVIAYWKKRVSSPLRVVHKNNQPPGEDSA